MAILITDQELEALDGLPHMDVVAYLALRRRMDFTTRVVGESARVSRQALIEALEVPATQGRSREVVSVKSVRCALGRLQSAGLLRALPTDDDDRRLLFLMPLAASAQERPKKLGPNWGRQAGPEEGPNKGRRSVNDCNASGGFDYELGPEEGPPQNGEVGPTSYGLRTPLSSTLVNQSTVERVAGGSLADGVGNADQNPKSEKRSAGGVVAPAIAVVKVLADQAGLRVSTQNPAVQAIAELGPTPEQLAEAVIRCKTIRANDGSNAPINLAFVRSNVVAVQRAGRVKPPSNWRSDTRAAQQYARALGVPSPDGLSGESMADFVARIAAFARAAEERAQA